MFSLFHHLQKDKQRKQRHSLKLGKKRRESSKREYYIISPRVIIKAIIIIRIRMISTFAHRVSRASARHLGHSPAAHASARHLGHFLDRFFLLPSPQASQATHAVSVHTLDPVHEYCSQDTYLTWEYYIGTQKKSAIYRFWKLMNHADLNKLDSRT